MYYISSPGFHDVQTSHRVENYIAKIVILSPSPISVMKVVKWHQKTHVGGTNESKAQVWFWLQENMRLNETVFNSRSYIHYSVLSSCISFCISTRGLALTAAILRCFETKLQSFPQTLTGPQISVALCSHFKNIVLYPVFSPKTYIQMSEDNCPLWMSNIYLSGNVMLGCQTWFTWILHKRIVPIWSKASCNP